MLKGQTYERPDGFANVLIRRKIAESIEDQPKPRKKEQKNAGQSK